MKTDLEILNDAPLECSDCLVNPLEITSLTDNADRIIEEINIKSKFEIDNTKFLEVLKSIQNPDDRRILIINHYNNMPDIVWNSIMEKAFQTKKDKNYHRNIAQKIHPLDFDIKCEPVNNLHEIRYKTSSCERTKAWSINGDEDFCNVKPEVLAQYKDFQYTVKGKCEEEYMIIPYQHIIDTLKIIDNQYDGIFEYIFEVAGTNISDLKLIKKKGVGAKALENNLQLLFGVLRFRNDINHGTDLVWNTIIKSRIIMKDLGYFTFSYLTKYLGNIWVDPRFRQMGIAKAMFKYITTKILPEVNYIFIMSKTPAMINLLDRLEEFDYKSDSYKYRTHYIGKSLPYEFLNNPNRKGLDFHLENLYVIDYNEQQLFIKDINLQLHQYKHLLFNENYYPSVLVDTTTTNIDNSYPSAHNLFLATRSWYNKNDTNINIIGYTNDRLVIPTYYDYYNDTNLYLTHLIYEFDGEQYLYPCHDKEDLFFQIPDTDIRTLSTPIQSSIIKYDAQDTVIIKAKYTTDTKYITLSRRLYTIEQIDNIIKFLKDLRFGIENIKLNLDDNLKPIEFDFDTLNIKFQTEDPSITIINNLREIF